MKTKIIGALLLSAAFVLPAVSSAATYEYVDRNGNLETLTADSSSQAIAMGANILPTSGVMLISNSSGPATYDFVNTSGSLESEVADSVEQALTQPTDIAPNSGVILQANLMQ
jgi:hypothetical protein